MNRNSIFAIVGAIVAAGVVFMLVNNKSDPNVAKPLPSATNPTVAETTPPPPPPPPPIASAPAPAYTIDPSEVKAIPNSELDMATVALEAKMITNAQDLLNQGKPRDALKQIDDYEKIPDRAALVPEAKFLKIQALGRVGGRRTDALALAMLTRTDPEMAPYKDRIEDFLADAGISGGKTFASP